MRPPTLDTLLATERPHGTRARYVAQKCRCADCRRANREYAAQRAAAAKAAAAELTALETAPGEKAHGETLRSYRRMCPGVDGIPCPSRSYLRKDSTGSLCATCRTSLTWNGLVDATPAREHLLALSAAGVGRDAVNAACDVAVSIIDAVRRGERLQLRRETERRILSVDSGARADHSLVPAKETRARIRYMTRRGWTRAEIARELGYASPALQIGVRDFVTAANALAVERLHRSFVDAERAVADLEKAGEYSQDERLVVLRRSGHLSNAELLEEYGHIWSNARTIARDRALLRDRQALDSVPDELAATEAA